MQKTWAARWKKLLILQNILLLDSWLRQRPGIVYFSENRLCISKPHPKASTAPGSLVRWSGELTELLLNLALQELHFGRLAVHQQHVSRLRHANELHDALCVCMRAEGHVLHLQLHIQLAATEKWIYTREHAHKTTSVHVYGDPTNTLYVHYLISIYIHAMCPN